MRALSATGAPTARDTVTPSNWILVRYKCSGIALCGYDLPYGINTVR